MSANATWDTAPAFNASSSSLLLQKQSGGGMRQISKAAAMALLGGKGGPAKVGPANPRGMNKLASSSTSALSHMTARVNSSDFVPSRDGDAPHGGGNDGSAKNFAFGAAGGAPQTRLRKETLMSLGISTTRSRSPKSCLKSGTGNGMRRASTVASIHEIEVMLPGSRSIRRNTSITFKDTVQVKRVPSSSSLAHDPKELWFQRDEEQQMRRTAKALVEVVDDSGIDPTLIDIRGLEGHTRFERKRSQARKHDTWDAVLDAQDFQRHTGDYDDEQIAALVRTVSRESLSEAQCRAQRDAAEARTGLNVRMHLPSGGSFNNAPVAR